MMEQLIQTVQQLFAQIAAALHTISDEQYCHKNNLMGDATIGQHVRHITEMYQQMVSGCNTGEINYDNRQRDYLIETNKEFAIQHMQALLIAINRADMKLCLITGYQTSDDDSLTIDTSFARELLYNIEHTVHHQALIKIGFKSAFAIDLPAAFGVAASTLKYRAACVQ